MDKTRISDFLKLIEELKALKSHMLHLDLARLEEEHTLELDRAFNAVEKRVRIRAPEELERLKVEERRIAEQKHEQNKEFLRSKFQRLDSNLLALGQFLKTLVPVQESEARLAGEADRLRKAEEEHGIQRKVLAHEQEELERDRGLMEAAKLALTSRQKEVDAKLANLDVARRAAALDLLREDLDGKLAAYGEQEALLEKQRLELNQDFDRLGQKRAELETDLERLQEERKTLSFEKARLTDVVARELSSTFEQYIREVLRPARPPATP